MSNADMPAMPVSGFEQDNGRISGQLHHGLTKREYFAGLAMQAFITADHLNGSEKRCNEDNALMAVDAADALLEELERTK